MSEIRDKVKDEVIRIILGREYTGFSAYDLAKLADKILSIPELAIVDRGAELPQFPYMSGECPICGGNLKAIPSTWGKGGGLYCKGDCNCYTNTETYRKLFMLKAGWVKEVKYEA